jgi:hypothetical protein
MHLQPSLHIHRPVLKAFLMSLVLTCLILVPGLARAGLIVFDDVTTEGTSIYIKVMTRGMLFAEGGRRVAIYLDDKAFARILTGGDGYGFVKYEPRRPGRIKVEAWSKRDAAAGMVLVLAETERVVLIDVEAGFKNILLDEDAVAQGRTTLQTLTDNFTVVYLSPSLGISATKTWLQDNQFPRSAVLPWSGPDLLDLLKKREVKLYAIIGSADIVEAAAEGIEHRYSFEETRKAQKVDSWTDVQEVFEKLLTEDTYDAE